MQRKLDPTIIRVGDIVKVANPQLFNRGDKSFEDCPYYKDDVVEVVGIKFVIVGTKIYKILRVTDDATTERHFFPIYKYAIEAKNVEKLRIL